MHLLSFHQIINSNSEEIRNKSLVGSVNFIIVDQIFQHIPKLGIALHFFDFFFGFLICYFASRDLAKNHHARRNYCRPELGSQKCFNIATSNNASTYKGFFKTLKQGRKFCPPGIQLKFRHHIYQLVGLKTKSDCRHICRVCPALP